ncbi:unnamed protein product [Effrenium voratum]|nr:unnamed protein product [Effrenium voratum]
MPKPFEQVCHALCLPWLRLQKQGVSFPLFPLGMRVVVVSDTHNQHQELEVPEGDLLIHCGDMTNRGSAPELAEVNRWFENLPHLHKVAICGNMDQRLESQTKEKRAKFLPSVMYLEDDAVEIDGLRIYGSPYTPKFCGAFQLDGEQAASEKWSAIPEDLDILITHGPPAKVLDCVGRGIHAGCPELLKRVERAQPRFHFFGHIHEEGGKQCTQGRTTFVNAAQHVMVFDIDPGRAAKMAKTA